MQRDGRSKARAGQPVGHACAERSNLQQKGRAVLGLGVAALQDPSWEERLSAALIAPLAEAQAAARAAIAGEAAATRVQFFTLATMRA